MKLHTLAAIILSLSVITGGCSAVTPQASNGELAIAAQNDEADETITVVSQDGTIQIATPTTWKNNEISAQDAERNTILKVSTQRNNIQLAVVAIPKAEGMDLSILSDAVALSAEAMVGQDGTVTPTDLTTINGMPSEQYEGRGELGGQAIGVLATGLDTPDMYYNILVAGKESHFDQIRAEVDQIIQSFEPAQASQP